ncbi:FabZ [Mangrovimonas xylaniphaga]|uniref:FabZ n=1 Tax=Mangrovimonas xylaniphaga TaxID=1645915 RepID=UPI0006B60334|nr:FabZ [Mangrovimonas xylaniphaga]
MVENEFPITDVLPLIPQRYPFVMVDALKEFSKTEVVSSFTILEDNIMTVQGGFTEPGLVENMAQTVALHTGYDYYRRGEEAPTGYIGSIKKTSIKKLPVVGDTVTTKAMILHEIMGVTMVNVKVYNAEGEEIASGEMKTVIAG